MITLKQLQQVIKEVEQLDTGAGAEVEEFFLERFGDLGLEAVDESEEDEEVYYDLFFDDGSTLTLSFLEAKDQRSKPILMVMSGRLDRELPLENATVEEDGGIDVLDLPLEMIREVFKEKRDKTDLEESLSEVFRWVIRGGQKIKKRVVRKRRHRISARQRSALRKARRFANRSGARRKRAKSNRKRKSLHLKAGVNKKGSLTYKLAGV